MTMTYHVHAVEQDMAGKWYARVCLSEEEAVFLKFDDYPAMDDIQAAAAQLVEAREAERIRARNELGQFIGDDPTTPNVNEAWVEVTDDAAAE
jgi:hypothetical protein